MRLPRCRCSELVKQTKYAPWIICFSNYTWSVKYTRTASAVATAIQEVQLKSAWSHSDCNKKDGKCTWILGRTNITKVWAGGRNICIHLYSTFVFVHMTYIHVYINVYHTHICIHQHDVYRVEAACGTYPYDICIHLYSTFVFTCI